jgi:hypothetical protein
MNDGQTITPRAVRDHLLAALQAGLEGPLDGDEELLRAHLPSLVYPVGVLASTEEDASLPDEPDPADDDPQDEDAEEGDDAPAERERPRVRRRQRSLGLTLLLDPAATALTCELAWGTYVLDDPAEDRDDDTGRRNRAWQRIPHRWRGTLALPTDGQPQVHPVEPGVELLVRCLPWTQRGDRPALAVSVFVTNRRTLPEGQRLSESQRMFQVMLQVEAPGLLLPRVASQPRDDDEEAARLDLHHRDVQAWAVGHHTATEPLPAPAGSPPPGVRTVHLPRAEVQASLTWEDGERREGRHHPGLEMERIAAACANHTMLRRLLDDTLLTPWRAWLERQKAAHLPDPDHARTRDTLCAEIEAVHREVDEGITRLVRNDRLCQAFAAMNRAMASQQRRGGDPSGPPPAWRSFQLAFLLACIPALPAGEGETGQEGSDERRRRVQLLFMPTGGGKTEAYLGLIGLTLLWRRLRERQRPGQGAGTCVLLRYTLRLLTLDQLLRASRLMCALELMRRDDEATWGSEPFSVGLWVGQSASPNRIEEAWTKAQETSFWEHRAGFPLTECPWCSHPIRDRRFLTFVPNNKQAKHVLACCENPRCEFSAHQVHPVTQLPWGLPMHWIDDAIYRQVPSLVIGTLDKFAMLPWRAGAGSLLGRVSGRRLDRPAGPGTWLPAWEEPALEDVRTELGLLPPELIVQDELHLIAGPIGTVASLYEAALDVLCSHRMNGSPAPPPFVVASTATARGARVQVRRLYGRDRVTQFPPPGIDAGDVFFARPDTGPHASPGRLYVGVASAAVAWKTLQIHIYELLLRAGMALWDDATRRGDDAARQTIDQAMTLLGYFNALRELGGMRRSVEGDLHSRLRGVPVHLRGVRFQGRPLFAERQLAHPAELTSRESTAQIAQTKADAGTPWTPDTGVDVLLATSMISVGVDIGRLGLMVISGQPKTQSEYIQASSRVGRARGAAGLVVTAYNIARARDRSHYEHFVPGHAALYRGVEAVTLTPHARRALERALDAALVTTLRHGVVALTPDDAAWRRFDGEHTAAADRLRDALLQALQARDASDAQNARVAARIRATEADWRAYCTLEAAHPGAPRTLLPSTDLARRPWSTLGNAARDGGILITPTDPSPGRFALRIGTSLRDVEPTCQVQVGGLVPSTGEPS